jgi:hypothetical protein
MSIGGARPERSRISVSGEPPIDDRDEEREILRDERIEALPHFCYRGRLFLECAESRAHVMGVDRLHVSDIGDSACTDVHASILSIAEHLATAVVELRFPIPAVKRHDREICDRDVIQATRVHAVAVRMRAGDVEGFYAAHGAEKMLRHAVLNW